MKSFLCIVVASLAMACVLAAPLDDGTVAADQKAYANFTFGDPKDGPVGDLIFVFVFGTDPKTDVAGFDLKYVNNTKTVSDNLANLSDKNSNSANLTYTGPGEEGKKVFVSKIVVDNGKNQTFSFCNKNATEEVVAGKVVQFNSCNSASSLFLGLGSVLVVILSMFSH